MKKKKLRAFTSLSLLIPFFYFPAGDLQPGAELFLKETMAAASDSVSLSTPVPAATATASSWMSVLDNEINLAQLSIPGTHESAARYEPFEGVAKCQDLSIGEQLNAGIRFLDIRCRNVKDSFAIYHGPFYQRLGFREVLDVCRNFLSAHPGEVIVMSIKEEFVAAGNTMSFEQVFLKNYVLPNGNLFYMGTDVPELGKIRGRIVLLRRFNAFDSYTGAANGNMYGIDATNWANNTTFTIHTGTAMLSVQDNYKIGKKRSKWDVINAHLKAAASGNGETLFINFASGYRPTLWIPDILAVSNAVNPHLNEYFYNAPASRYGIVPMDFVDHATPNEIFKKNRGIVPVDKRNASR